MDNLYFSQVGDLLADNIWLRVAALIFALLIVQLIIKLISGRIIGSLVRSKKFSSKRAESQREQTLTMVINRASAVIVWIVGVFFILGQLNINWSSILAGAGLVGIVIGFGAQKVAGDFIAGFFILLENQYGLGDIIEIKDMGAYGEVERIDLRTTHIRSLDGGMHIIANGNIVNMANHSYGWASALVYMWFDYDSDINKIEKLMNETGAEMVKDDVWGKELKSAITFDRVEDFGSDGLKIRALGNTAPGMQWAVAGEFRRRLKPRLDKAGIKTAYPRRVMQQAAAKKAS